MESRKVKVIDEHGIDREANVICKFTVDEKDYVLYSIERDSENDNLFVSKIINNNDETSNMVNIEDNMEKERINNVVKELITFSINTEERILDGKVVLSDGKSVKISSVLVNKDQIINVGKTYVTTVKKAVTKVSEDFYKVEEVKVTQPTSQIFEAMKGDVFEAPVIPEESALGNNMSVQTVASETPKVEPVLPTVSEEKNKSDISTVQAENNVAPVQNVIEPEIKTPVVDALVTSNAPIANNNLENVQVINNKVEEPVVQGEKSVLPVTNVVEPEVKPIIEPITPSVQVSNEAPMVQPILPVEPIQSVNSGVSTEQISNVETSEPKLFFDGSKETNLNMALGEASEEKTMSTGTEGVQALRQFGSDEPILPPQETILPAQENVKTLTRSKGFANNKFFVIVAIAFFIAACVFLGYEAFQYFQIAG